MPSAKNDHPARPVSKWVPLNRPKGSVVCLAQVEGLGSPVNNDP